MRIGMTQHPHCSRRILGFALALLFVLTIAVAPVGPAVTASAADGFVTLGGGDFRVELYDTGSMGVFVYGIQQFYSEHDYGFVWHIGGNKYTTGYIANGVGHTPTAPGTLGRGTLTGDGDSATITWELDGFVFSTVVTVDTASLTVNQTWSITNNTGEPVEGARLIAGGDTYFAGYDSGYAASAEGGGVKIYLDAISGDMSFIPVTTADGYFGGSFADGLAKAWDGMLSNTITETRTDQSYYLQWDVDVPNGATATVEAKQVFAAPSLVVTPPVTGYGYVGGTLSMTYRLMNTSVDAISVDLYAEAGDFLVTLTANGSVVDSVIVPANGYVDVTANIDIPGDADLGIYEIRLQYSLADSNNGAWSGASFYVVQAGDIPVSHSYYLDGALQGTADSSFAAMLGIPGVIPAGLLRVAYQNIEYDVVSIKISYTQETPPLPMAVSFYVNAYAIIGEEEFDLLEEGLEFYGEVGQYPSFGEIDLERDGYTLHWIDGPPVLSDDPDENVYNAYYIADEEPSNPEPLQLGLLGVVPIAPMAATYDSDYVMVGDEYTFFDGYEYQIEIEYSYTTPPPQEEQKIFTPPMFTPTVTPPVQEVEPEPVPQAPAPEEPAEEPAEEPTEVFEDDVPLADLPKTGVAVPAMASALAGLGLTLMSAAAAKARKRQR